MSRTGLDSRRRRITSSVVGLLIWGGSSAVWAQDAPPAVFTEILDVRVVNVEVVVTDRQGNRIHGLGAEDFRLLVDGSEVEIAYFTEVRGGVAVEAEEAETSGVPVLAAGQPVGTSYLLFIDEFFSLQSDRDRTVRALIDQLEQLGPHDRMAIVAFDGERVDMLSSWSQRPRELERVLREALERPARGMQPLAERRQVARTAREQRLLFQDLGVLDRTDLDLYERAYVERLIHQLERATLAAASALRGFASPPGRKVMLLLSGGWPWMPAEFLLADPQRLLLEETRGSGDLYGALTDTANRLGYTIYAVEVPGLSTTEERLADITEPAPPGLRPFETGAIRRGEIRSSLVRISERTGGRAILGGERETALAAASEDTRSYYWLGFRPEWQQDDKPRSIEVRVERPGLRVRSRSSYLDLSREREVDMMVESSLLFGAAPQSRPLPVRLGEVERVRRRAVSVPLEIAIPTGAVAFLPVEDQWVAEVELRLAARDSQGRTTDIIPIPLRLAVSERPEEGAFLRYETTMELRRDRHTVVIVLFDPVTGTVLSSRLEFEP